MSTTTDLLDLAKERTGLTTDYKLAQALGWAVSQVSNYRTGRRGLGDDQACELADLAKVPREYALALIAAERTTSAPARVAFLRAAERLAA